VITLGLVIVVTVTYDFLKTVFGSAARREKLAELQAEHDHQQIENAAREDVTEEQRLRRETKINQRFARELSRLDEDAAKVSRRLLWFAAAGGIAGIAALLGNLGKLKDMIVGSESSLEFLISSAFAADPTKSELTPLLPYVAVGVVLVMGASFLIALGTILVVKDTRENQARIKAADNIVKTFGGFFTGLATTLLH
jgi:hypothetical protein